MKKKILLSLGLLIIVSLLISACNGGQTSQPASQATNPPAQSTSAPSGEPVTIKMWAHIWDGSDKANKDLIDKFMQQNPDIKVVYETFDYGTFIQTLQTSVVAGTEADVIQMFGTWACDYAKGNRLLEVPSSLMTYDQAKGTFFKSQLDGYYCDNKLYGFPREYNLESSGIMINPTMFQEAGIANPPDWKTFDDVIADAQKLTKFDNTGMMTTAGLDIHGDEGVFVFLASILELGGDYRAADGLHFNFNTPEGEKALQFLVDLIQKYKVYDPIIWGSSDLTESFFKGQVAMAYGGTWLTGGGSQFPDTKFDYVKLPPFFGSQHQYAADSGWGIVVSAHTKYPEAAWKLAQFLALNEDNAREWNAESMTIPGMISVANNPGVILEKNPYVAIPLSSDVMANARYIGPLGDRDQFFGQIWAQISKAMTGEITVKEALQEMEKQGNELIDNKK